MNLADFNNKLQGLDKSFGFVKLITVNPTAFLRFGERRQFFYS